MRLRNLVLNNNEFRFTQDGSVFRAINSVGEGQVNMSEFKDAEKMFKFYSGSTFFMDREGDYERYKKFNVPQEMEYKWRCEMKGELFEKLTNTSNCSLIAD